MKRVLVNTRSLSTPLTGVQRYTRELLARWNGYADQIKPSRPLHGITGHLWEQVVLPSKLQDSLLFSPSNSGPLEVRHQVVTVHDMVYFDHPETLNRKFAAWYRFLLPRLVRRVRAVITVSDFIKERVIARTGLAPGKIFVVPNGVGPQFRPEAIAGRDYAVQQLGIPNCRYILSLGSVEPRKNILRLLHSWERIHNAIPDDVWLVVAGGEGNRAIFRNRRFGSLPPRVHFSGRIPDEILPALIAGAIGVAYPSIYEGFGLPALEAMASGVPVLAGSCPALAEVVGDAGILIDPLDEEAISDALRRLIEDEHLRRQMRDRGLARAERFSWDKAARSTWDVLQQVASSN